jgi:putative transcriptional regulator
MTLRELRKESGLKMYKLAETLNISRQQYRNIESGKYRISSDKVEKLAEKFGKEPLEILKAWEEGKNAKA